MCSRLWSATILAGLLTWQTAAARADDVVRLPPVGDCPNFCVCENGTVPFHGATRSGSESVATAGTLPGQPAEGTWREDGGQVIINLDGREIRLAKSPAGQGQSDVRNRSETIGGTVYSRLLDHGHPLVNCHVVLVPMHQEQGVYCFDPDRKALSTTTDAEGAYRFENVPAGEYKLTWLPQGQNQWIRRIAMRPDVKVRAGETTSAKEIRVAMQTIN
jgi:hypothetical protein